MQTKVGATFTIVVLTIWIIATIIYAWTMLKVFQSYQEADALADQIENHDEK